MPRTLACSVLVAFALIGCGQSPSVASPTAEHLRSDNDRYFAAYEEAFAVYEYEVVSAARHQFANTTEAQVVQQSHAARRFEGLFEQALRRRGLSVRGFEVHRTHHPELAAQIGVTYGARYLELRRAVSSLDERVSPAGSLVVAFDQPTDGRYAAR